MGGSLNKNSPDAHVWIRGWSSVGRTIWKGLGGGFVGGGVCAPVKERIGGFQNESPREHRTGERTQATWRLSPAERQLPREGDSGGLGTPWDTVQGTASTEVSQTQLSAPQQTDTAP